METPTALGSPQLTGDAVMGKDCSIYAHSFCQTAKAVVAVVTRFRLRHLTPTLLQVPTSLAFFWEKNWMLLFKCIFLSSCD